MKTTYFGLAVHQVDGTECVRLADVQRLPFFPFWLESASGSTILVDDRTGEQLVYLHDWQAFAHLFIKTGRHRFSGQES